MDRKLLGHKIVWSAVIYGTVEPLCTYGHLSITDPVSNVTTNFSYVFFKKPLYTDSLKKTTDTKSRPQRVNSYKINLFITDTAVISWIPNPDQVNLHRVNLVWLVDDLRKVISKAQSLYYKRRFAKGVQRNLITNFFKAWITTDSVKTFSITFCTLVTVYCTCKKAKDAFRIVLYVTSFCLQHCAGARFVLKQWFLYDCTHRKK